jgi:DNA helicase-4
MTTHGRLFVVGDDWQSIYRFTGSDINIITRLPERVGATAQVDLDVAFRYSQELLDATAAFVMKNPRQLKKQLRAFDGHAGEKPILVVHEHQKQPLHPTHAFETIVNDIVDHAVGQPSTVYVIGRYHRNKPKFFDDIVRMGRQHGITFEFHTAHASKGKEAD